MITVKTLQAISECAVEEWRALEKQGAHEWHHGLLTLASVAAKHIYQRSPANSSEVGRPGTVRKNRQRSRQRRKVVHVINMDVYESELALLTSLGLLPSEQRQDTGAVAHAIENLMYHAALAFPTARTGPNVKMKDLKGRYKSISRTWA